MNVVSACKATVDHCTALTVTLTPSLLFLYVRTYIFEAITKLAQLHKRLHIHTYVSGFRHFPHESARNSCLDSFARHRAENLHGIVRQNPSTSAQISVSTYAGNSRNSSQKCKLSVSSTVSMMWYSKEEHKHQGHSTWKLS